MVKKGKPVTKLSSEDKRGKVTGDRLEVEGKLEKRIGPDEEQEKKKIDDWFKSLDQKESKSETSKDHSGSKKNE